MVLVDWTMREDQEMFVFDCVHMLGGGVLEPGTGRWTSECH